MTERQAERKKAWSQRSKAESKAKQRREKNGRKQRWKANSRRQSSVGRVWEDLFSSVLFTGSSFKVPQMAAFTERAFYCIFPSPINSLYLHLCVGKYDCCCCCCLAQGRSHLGFLSDWIAHLLQVDCREPSPSEELILTLALSGYVLCLCVCACAGDYARHSYA